MKIHYPLDATGFDTLLDNENKEARKTGKEIICAILYLENYGKARFSDLKKRI